MRKIYHKYITDKRLVDVTLFYTKLMEVKKQFIAGHISFMYYMFDKITKHSN